MLWFPFLQWFTKETHKETNIDIVICKAKSSPKCGIAHFESKVHL